MNVDALVLWLVAFADVALIVLLRRRRNRRVRQDRMMGSLRFALRWANASSRNRKGARLPQMCHTGRQPVSPMR